MNKSQTNIRINSQQKVNKSDWYSSFANTSLFILAILLFIIPTGFISDPTNSSNLEDEIVEIVNDDSIFLVDDNEDLYRIAQSLIFRREYDKAIKTYELIIERDSNAFLAKHSLSELYLAKGLNEMDYFLSEHYFELSQKYSNEILVKHKSNTGSLLLSSLASIQLSELNSENKRKNAAYLLASLVQIKKGLDVNPHFDKLWFAMGEWWTYAVNISEEDIPSFINKYFPDLSPEYLCDYSCYHEQAEIYYQKAIDERDNSIFGNYGLMRMSYINKDEEQFIDAYCKIPEIAGLFPLEYYYVEKAKSLYNDFIERKSLHQKNPVKYQAPKSELIPNAL